MVSINLEKGTRKAEITPRDHFLLANSKNFDDSFLQNQYEFLSGKGYIPHDDIGMIRIKMPD